MVLVVLNKYSLCVVILGVKLTMRKPGGTKSMPAHYITTSQLSQIQHHQNAVPRGHIEQHNYQEKENHKKEEAISLDLMKKAQFTFSPNP